MIMGSRGHCILVWFQQFLMVVGLMLSHGLSAIIIASKRLIL